MSQSNDTTRHGTVLTLACGMTFEQLYDDASLDRLDAASSMTCADGMLFFVTNSFVGE